jgi:arginyl-tRNA--protein-N-Asp/Glu arginylyltransferase
VKIKPNENKEQVAEVEKLEIAPLVESIITEDYSVNKLEEKLVEEIVEPVAEKVPVVESIITEDYSVNKLVEEKVEETIVPVSEVKSFAESIITEDYSLNKLFEKKSEEQIIDSLAEPEVEKNPVVESIITEDYSINKLEETILPVQETIVAEIKPVTETLVAKLEEQNPISFAAQLESKSKEETSLFEHLEQKLNPTPQSQLFELFDDGKEELHETFANNQSSFTEPVNMLTDTKTTTSVYEQNDSVLVMEKEVETIVEQLTPSSLNDIFKPQTAVESLHSKASKTLSESIALNDKFIFCA